MVKEKKIKKYKTPYIFFVQDETEKMRKEKQNNLNLIAKMKIIGNKWKNLPNNIKQIYIKKSELDKEKFNKIKLESGIQYKYKKKKEIVKKIKRFRTPFMIYLHDNKDKIDKHNSVESLKIIAKTWKEMDYKDKKIYFEKAQEDKERYKNELILKIKNEIKNKISKEKSKEKINKLISSMEKLYEKFPEIIYEIKEKLKNEKKK